MSFRYPWLLALLEILPLLLMAWVWLRRGRRVPLPIDHTTTKRRKWLDASIRAAEMMSPILLAIAIAILCGPIELSAPQSRRKLTNIEFCVDVSGSMTASFGPGTRYDASMKAIDEFLEMRSGDAFGLTFFGNTVLHWVPLTTDPSAIRCAPPFMRPEIAPPWMGGTEIGKALMACRKVLTERESGDRMIILVSDGGSFDLENGADEQIARELRSDEIVVHTIHVGGGEVPGPVVNVTRLTGGEVFQPGDTQGLGAVFAQIDSMKQTELEKVAAETNDAYRWFAVAGLGMLGMHLLLGLGWRYVPW